MVSFTEFIFSSAVLAVAQGHGVILNAQGIAGSPASVGFQGVYGEASSSSIIH